MERDYEEASNKRCVVVAWMGGGEEREEAERVAAERGLVGGVCDGDGGVKARELICGDGAWDGIELVHRHGLGDLVGELEDA